MVSYWVRMRSAARRVTRMVYAVSMTVGLVVTARVIVYDVAGVMIAWTYRHMVENGSIDDLMFTIQWLANQFRDLAAEVQRLRAQLAALSAKKDALLRRLRTLNALHWECLYHLDDPAYAPVIDAKLKRLAPTHDTASRTSTNAAAHLVELRPAAPRCTP